MFPARLRRPRATQSTATKLAALLPQPCRARSRASAVGLLIALATMGLALAPQAASAASGSYTPTISPTVAQTGTSTTFTVTFTNKSATNELRQAVVRVPLSFKVTAAGPATPANFTVSRAGNVITLQGGSLLPGASLSVPITATVPTVPGAYKLGTSASGPNGGFTRVGNDPVVTVAKAAASVVCNANTPCSAPTLSAGASPMALATDAQITAQSGPAADQLSVVLPDPTAAPLLCQSTSGNFGSIVTWNVTARTSSLVYTVHSPNSLYTYDLTDTCFGSTQPFPGAVQNPANGNEFEGTLPYCSTLVEGVTVTSPPPCVQSIVTTGTGHPNDPETVTVTINAPQGDPKFTG